MSDLISRQVAIDVIEKLFPTNTMRNDYTEGITVGVALALDFIKQLPSAQQWTPVTEGLPKDLKPVNITYINENPAPYYEHIKGIPFTATAIYYRGGWYWWSCTCVDVLAEYGHSYSASMDEGIEVKAWMPLPEPYKAESEDKE